MKTATYALTVIENGGRFQARLSGDDGEVYESADHHQYPHAAIAAATANCPPLYRMRPSSSRRGPDVTVRVYKLGGWPLSNLHIDGCKHSPTVEDDRRFGQGETVECAKCGAKLVPVDDPEAAT